MVQRIDISLNELRPLQRRIDGRHLETDDWPIIEALVAKLIDRAEARQARMLAKIAAQAQEDAESASTGESSIEPASEAESTSEESATQPESDETEKKRPKGHGRNGVAAFTNAQHINHELKSDIIGTVCENCGSGRGAGRMSRYREKVIIRIVGQPLFGAEVHHYEQSRCRMCGTLITADGTAEVLEGIGSSYITYDWSACAMLTVMHYFAGAPFKRLESLHNSWGVPMPDANQWKIVDACSELLDPLFREPSAKLQKAEKNSGSRRFYWEWIFSRVSL